MIIYIKHLFDHDILCTIHFNYHGSIKFEVNPIESIYAVHLPAFTINIHQDVGKYTSPMDPMGMVSLRTMTQ